MNAAVDAGSLNQIPAAVLNRFNANQIVLITEGEGDAVLGTTRLDPRALQPIDGLGALASLRQREGVHSITVTMLRLTRAAIEEATRFFEERFRLIAELDALLQHVGEVYVAYAVTHFNFAPLNEHTVFIGGDCYRTGAEIRDLASILSRTKDLARAMVRKAVMIFPDIPGLHGGKKGEWIVLDADGHKIDGISEQAIVALGTLIIPKGIAFLNAYKQQRAAQLGIFPSFPSRDVIRPDTASPDVVSGPNWRSMCHVWQKRGVDMSMVTCLPDSLGGPLAPSSLPTAYGAVATALRLVQHRLPERPLSRTRFLLEALGGVGQTTVRGLLERGADPANIRAFDKRAEPCKIAADKFGIDARAMPNDEFYSHLEAGDHHDVWINNGEGDNTTPQYVEKLLAAGVKVFCGAANNLFAVASAEQSRRRIFESGAWAWPDEASSGGGWTLAVIDLYTRARGQRSDTREALDQILTTIQTRNERLVDEVVTKLRAAGTLDGAHIWSEVDRIINERVRSTMSSRPTPADIARLANVTGWNLA